MVGRLKLLSGNGGTRIKKYDKQFREPVIVPDILMLCAQFKVQCIYFCDRTFFMSAQQHEILILVSAHEGRCKRRRFIAQNGFHQPYTRITVQRRNNKPV